MVTRQERIAADKTRWEEFTGQALPVPTPKQEASPEAQFFMTMLATMTAIDGAKSAIGDAWRECPDDAKLSLRESIHRHIDHLYVDSFATIAGQKSTFRIVLDGKISPCKATSMHGATKALAKAPGESKLEVLAPNGEWIEVS